MKLDICTEIVNNDYLNNNMSGIINKLIGSPYPINQNLQIKLSQVLQNSLYNYRVQPDSVIMLSREGSTVDVYFCDPDFTSIQYQLAIEDVKNLNNINIKYNYAAQPKVTIVSRKSNQIHFYDGKLPVDNTAVLNSSITSAHSSIIAFDKNHEVLSISRIGEIQGVLYKYLITTSKGRSFILQYNCINHQLQLVDTAIQNLQSKIGGYFNSFLKPLISTQTPYKTCQSFVYLFDRSQSLYSLELLDLDLEMKFINLSSLYVNRYKVINSWKLSLKQYLESDEIIVAKMFSCGGANNKHLVSMIIISSAQNQKINLIQLTIDFNMKIQNCRRIANIFGYRNSNEDQFGSNYDNQDVTYNRMSVSVQVEQFDSNIYVFYHRRCAPFYSINKSSPNNILLTIQRDQNNLLITNRNILNLNGEVKLFKISNNSISINNNAMQWNVRAPNLLIIGQSSCWSLSQPVQKNQGINQKVGNSSSNSLTKARVNIPPIPQYYQSQANNQKHSRYDNMDKSEADSVKNEKKFSSSSIQRLINKKDYKQLFQMLQIQKNIFYQGLENRPFMEESCQKLSSQLVIMILLAIFVQHKGLNSQFNAALADRIFTKYMFTRDKQNFSQLMVELFQNKSIHSLKSVIQALRKQRQFSQIYKICVETIPNFLLQIQSKRSQNQNGSANKDMTYSQIHQSGQIQRFKKQVILNYLNIYQQMITQILGKQKSPDINKFSQSKKQMQELPQVYFSQYEHKQLLDKYLKIRKLTNINQINHDMEENKYANIVQLNSIFELYLSNNHKMAKFLVAMAIKHSNDTLFDFVIRKRFITKQDIEKYIQQKQIQKSNQNIQLLLLNMVNNQIKGIKNLLRDSSAQHCLQCLLWIPSKYSQKVYQHLIASQPKLALVYGMTVKKRRQVANDIRNNSNLRLYQQIKNCATIQQFYQPFYSSTEDPELKLNVDLCQLFWQSNCFISAKRLLKFNFGSNEQLLLSAQQNSEVNSMLKSIKIRKEAWLQFSTKIRKYLNSQQINQLQQTLTQFII